MLIIWSPLFLKNVLFWKVKNFITVHAKCQGTSRNLGECCSYSGRSTILTLVLYIWSAGKRSQMHQKGSVTPRNSKMLKDSAVPRANVTPSQTTPKTHKNLCLKKTESPASPLASPSPSQHAMVIHKMFGSPEVEVSWDWGCSQLVNQIGM